MAGIGGWAVAAAGIGGGAAAAAAGMVKGTASVGYTVIEADAGKVRTALKDAAGRGELLAMNGDWVGWASMDEWVPPTEQSDFGIFAHVLNNWVKLEDGTSVAVLAGQADSAFLEPRGGLVHVRMPGELRETRLQGNDGVVTKSLMMSFTGDVPTGRAVVFVEDLGKKSGAEIYHVSIWEAFPCSEAEWPYVHNGEMAEWREGGVGPLKEKADRVLAWESMGHAAKEVGSAWQRTLKNGAVVRVLAVCDINRWPGCWWDAEGNPVQTPKEWLHWNMGAADPHEDVRVAIGIEDPTAIVASDAGFSIRNNVMGDSRSGVSIAKLENGAVEVGIGAGPCKDVGKLKLGQTLEVAGMKAMVKELEAGSPKMANVAGSTWVHGQMAETPEWEGEVVAFDKAGNEAKAWGIPSLVTDRKELQQKEMTPTTSVVNLDAGDIGKLELRVRERSWVRFEGIAMKPRVDPESAKVAAIVKPRAQEAGVPTTQPGDRTTPEGVTRMFMAAIKAQDGGGARKLMAATTGEEQAIADAMVSNFVGNVALRDAALKRFGESETKEALVRPGLCYEMPGMPEGDWKIEGETARFVGKQQNVMMTGGPGSTLVRMKGAWFLDMALPKDLDEEKRKELPGQVAMQQAMGALDMEVAKGIAAGKYADAYAARDALQAGMKKIRE